MSLLCTETGQNIRYGNTLSGATRCDATLFFALSGEATRKIPKAEKRSTPCKHGAGGVDIHMATSSKNGLYSENYSLCGFMRGKFRYSISQATAEKYLPHLMKCLAANTNT